MSGSRIILVSTGLGRGGAETQLIRVGTHLRARGHEVDVVSLIDRNRWVDEIREGDLTYHCLHARSRRPNVRPLARFAALVARRRPHAIGAFLFGASVLSVAVGRSMRVPRVVVSVRGGIPTGSAEEHGFRAMRRVADAVVFNSSALRDDALERGIVVPERTHLVRNAIDLDAFAAASGGREETRRSLGVAPDETMWLAVGNVRPIKNLPALVDAFARTEPVSRRARLFVVGYPYEDAEPMQRIAPGLWESGHLVYLGMRRDIPALMSAADRYALSSLHEGTPNTVLEAMAAGVPVLATAVGGVPEIVKGRGWLAATPSVDDLEAGIRALDAATPEERSRRVAAAAAWIDTEHATPAVVDRWERVLLDE